MPQKSSGTGIICIVVAQSLEKYKLCIKNCLKVSCQGSPDGFWFG